MASIVVTGASTGIGRETVEHLARLGHTVFAGVRNASDADTVTGLGSSVFPMTLDVTQPDLIAASAATVAEHVGSNGVHGLVNNAGIAVGGPLEHLPIDDLRRQLEVNVVAQVAVTQAMLPLIRRATGRVVFIGSLSGRVGLPMIGAYSASKFALEGLTEAWRAELVPWRIKVILIEPGSIRTEIWGKGRKDVAEVEQRYSPEVVERYQSHINMARQMIDRQAKLAIAPTKVAKVVQAALFDARPRARYLVGIDAKSAAAMTRLLPDRLRSPLISVATGTRLPRAQP